MTSQHDDLPQLEVRRRQLYEQMREVGDFRRGSFHEVRRRCGKSNCACAAPDHPGHGPQYNLTRSEGGKTVNRHLQPGPELTKVRREVGNYQRFRALVDEVVEVNDQICEVRPVIPTAEAEAAAEKKGSKRRFGRRSPAK
ncbi:MAG TPA: DUF6788 family protein [Thermomicrobiaceae bacterium]|nr:DUF6788 family protein [Thermomicrobiaceae bacterium]